MARKITKPAKAGSPLIGSCHCGDVRIEIPRMPRSLTSCNCSICRRYGALWAYFRANSVRVIAKRGALPGYVWGRKTLRFRRCARCGCITHWEALRPPAAGRIGVIARNFDPADLSGLRIRHFDGFESWSYLD